MTPFIIPNPSSRDIVWNYITSKFNYYSTRYICPEEKKESTDNKEFLNKMIAISFMDLAFQFPRS